jgi:hypothetical protein
MPSANDLISALLASPEEQAAVAQASRAAAQHLRRPDVAGFEGAQQRGRTPQLGQFLEGIAGTAAMAHPAAWPGLLIDALSTPAGAKGLQGLTPNTTAMTSAGGELPPRLQELQQMIDKATTDLKNRAPIMKSVTTGSGKNRSRSAEPDIAATEYRDRETKEQIAEWRKEAQGIINSRKTFEEVASPEAKMAVKYGIPAFGAATAIPFGLKAGLKPYLEAAGLGAAEGAFGGFVPEWYNLTLPKGSPGREQASKNLGDLNYWKEEVLPEAFAGAVTSAIGAGLGKKGQTVWDVIRGKGHGHGAPPPAPTAPVPQAPMAPIPQAPIAPKPNPMAPMMNIPQQAAAAAAPSEAWEHRGRTFTRLPSGSDGLPASPKRLPPGAKAGWESMRRGER